MTEPLGIATSIFQIASAGVALSTALYDFVGSANRADSDIVHVADDLRLTANALDSMGKVFENVHGQHALSEKAVQDARDLIMRCETVFNEIHQVVDRLRKVGIDGKESLSPRGKPAWPITKERAELLRRRLENLKISLTLMLHILHLANGQARGEIEKGGLDQERENVRELHQRQQESLHALQALERKLGHASLSDNETVHGSTAPSRVPTIDFLVNTPSRSYSMSTAKNNSWSAKSMSTLGYLSDDLQTSGSDNTMTDDEDEQLTSEEITRCATHVQTLLDRITFLQHSLETASEQTHAQYPKHRVHKLYRRFCRKFESEVNNRKVNDVASATPFPGFRPSHTLHHDMVPQEVTSRSEAVEPSHTTSNLPISDEQQQQKQQQWTHQNPTMVRTTTGPLLAHSDSTHDGHVSDIQSQPIRETSLAASTGPKTDTQGGELSRESSKDGSQSGADRDIEQASQGSLSVHYTKTGRVSKAKKGLKVHTCSECGKSFTRAEHLRRHQKNHGPDQVSCHLCGKVFFRVDLLMRHIERHKDGPIVNTTMHEAQASDPPHESKPNPSLNHTNEENPRPAEPGIVNPTQSSYYVWNQAEKRYDLHYTNNNTTPPTATLTGVPIQYSYPSQTQQVGMHPAYHPFRHETTEPAYHERTWQYSTKRRRTEGTLYQAPPSPTRSPPSPWIKDSRTLPPLRPSSSQASVEQVQDRLEDKARVLVTPPALQQAVPTATTDSLKQVMPASQSVGTNENYQADPSQCVDATAAQILMQATVQRVPVEYASDGLDTSRHSQPHSISQASQQAERAQRPPLQVTVPRVSNIAPSEPLRSYSLASPASGFSKSQPTSPATSSTIRTYPNPIRPHGVGYGHPLGRPAKDFAKDIAAVETQFAVPRVSRNVQQRAKDLIVHTHDRDNTSAGRELGEELGDQASRKRGIQDNTVENLGENKRRRLEGLNSARTGKITNRDGNDANVIAEGGRDIVDVLLDKWTAPAH
ncbi:hypothetical protein P280DRAFT_464512 [Massarina eburnea CBS 473.64]|uniref:C2H2-type domain-containing protein n=1 Tax=Massarina eburnea CBS 473.64 TaxID=1395130 RepID=A0A6A6SFE9_9PLEO|nr:hypothetical protein P280DRAFT_464512 [Massarina eburnea CBS 473.64]